MADGWMVEVTTQRMGGGSLTEVWYAHIPNRAQAEDAVRMRVQSTPDVEILARSTVPHNALVALGCPEGGVSQ